MAIVPCCDGSIVFLDCEGSDNPFSRSGATYQLVAVVAFVLAQLLIHCDFGEMSDSTMEALATTVAARRMLQTRGEAGTELLQPKLAMLLQAPRFEVQEEDMHSLLNAETDSRRAIKTAFSSTWLVTLPDLRDTTYSQQVDLLREKVKDSIPQPLSRAGVCLAGCEIVDVLHRLCKEMGEWAAPLINAEGIYTSVVRARLERIAAQATELHAARRQEQTQPCQFGALGVSAMEAFKASCSEALAYFDSEAEYICCSLRDEVRSQLEYRLGLPEEEIRRGEERVAWAVARTVRDAVQHRAADWAFKFLEDPICSGSQQAKDWLLKELVDGERERASARLWKPRRTLALCCMVGCCVAGVWTSGFRESWPWTHDFERLSDGHADTLGLGHETVPDTAISSVPQAAQLEDPVKSTERMEAAQRRPSTAHRLERVVVGDAPRRDGSLEAFWGIFEPSLHHMREALATSMMLVVGMVEDGSLRSWVPATAKTWVPELVRLVRSPREDLARSAGLMGFVLLVVSLGYASHHRRQGH
mmetsp:Transcript_42681/g.95890  ORF Transcript_42681/g.95890 Transcript_42681/m.95890 type:complete len:530 (-) Transcript_42681:15-1604(-)